MSKSLAKTIVRRLILAVITVLIVTVIVFFLSHLIPGDPVVNYLGANASEEQIAYYTHLYGLDQPLIVQYFKWLGGLFTGDMGFSISYQKGVSEIIFDRLFVTLSVTIPAFIIAVILGIVLGVIAALHRGKLADTVISFIANIGVSMPLFWSGMILILVFGLLLRWLPTSSYAYIDEGFVPYVRHLILPVIVCCFHPLATFTRQTRTALLDVMNQEYVVTAKAKGLKHRAVVFGHMLRNALIPIITVMGSQFGTMVGTTVLIESVFVLPGLGNLMINGINSRDYMVMTGCILLIAIFVAVCNLIVDILYTVVDPRVRDK